jgi:hypothetical protein
MIFQPEHILRSRSVLHMLGSFAWTADVGDLVLFRTKSVDSLTLMSCRVGKLTLILHMLKSIHGIQYLIYFQSIYRNQIAKET